MRLPVEEGRADTNVDNNSTRRVRQTPNGECGSRIISVDGREGGAGAVVLVMRMMRRRRRRKLAGRERTSVRAAERFPPAHGLFFHSHENTQT